MSTTSAVFDVQPRTEEGSSGTGSWLAFCLLAVYGTVRWGTMLEPPDQGRLILSLGLALLNAVALRRLPRRGNRDWLIPLLCLADVVLVLLIAGFPFASVLGGHWGRLGSGLANGISTIPGVLVPYRGQDPNTVAVIALGASALLLCGGLAFGNVRGRPATGQLLLAALPLLALAIVPSAIVQPKIDAVHGMVTFVLVALLVLSPRLTKERRSGGTVLLVTAAIAGAAIAGVVAGTGQPWLRVATGHALAGAGTGTGTGPELFNWTQLYGKLGPGSQTTVLTVKAKRATYWKTEDLDRFSGGRWETGLSSGNGLLGVTTAHLKRYSESLTVTDKDIISDLVVAAGYAYAPNLLGVSPGNDPGTFVTQTALEPVQSYNVDVYAPDPTAAQLATTGNAYPAMLDRFRGLNLPGNNAYAGVQALANRLSAGTTTAIGYVDAVLNYLQSGHGYTYTLSPPKGGRYPLVSFLLDSKRGYCQQFAGAMALLLRMRHIPARVAVGFSTGTRQAHSDTYLVSGSDAHAWVEVWFPSYGWVTFDPTPAKAGTPNINAGGRARASAGAASAGLQAPESKPSAVDAKGSSKVGPRQRGRNPGAGASRHTRGGGVPVLAILAVLVGLALIGWLLRQVPGYWRRPTTAELADELERAFAMCREPLGADVTLAALARRLADSPRAAAYIRALSASRYEARAAPPTAGGRAALRLWLARRLGLLGIFRALRALPPRRSPRALRQAQPDSRAA